MEEHLSNKIPVVTHKIRTENGNLNISSGSSYVIPSFMMSSKQSLKTRVILNINKFHKIIIITRTIQRK